MLNTICPPSRQCRGVTSWYNLYYHYLPLVISIRFVLFDSEIPRWLQMHRYLFCKQKLLENELRESNRINITMHNPIQMSGNSPGCGYCGGFSSEFHDYRRRFMDLLNNLPQICRRCFLKMYKTALLCQRVCVCVCVCVFGLDHQTWGVFVAMPGGR